MQNAFRDSGSQLNSTELHSSKLNPPVSQRFDAEPENVPTPVPWQHHLLHSPVVNTLNAIYMALE